MNDLTLFAETMSSLKCSTQEVKHSPPKGEARPASQKVRKKIMHPFWIVSAVLFITASILLLKESNTPLGLLFFMPFSFGPMVFSLFLGCRASSKKCLLTLLVANILYFVWFLWVYLEVFYLHPDPQGPIAFIFIGVYSLPVMIPLWIVAFRFQTRDILKTNSKIE